MANYKIILEYNGFAFSGSQKQQDKRTVEGELEKVFQEILGHPVDINFAGRTDTGVHALGQVINFHSPVDDLALNSSKTLLRFNSQLPSDIVLASIELVDDDFHARYSAKSREYMYKIFLRRQRPVLRLDSLHWVKEDLDIELLAKQAEKFLGTHDFASYTKDKDKNTIIKVSRSEIEIESKFCIKYWIKADRFLRHMVRRIVGDLIMALPEDKPGCFAAPAKGLTLMKVEY